LSLLGYQIIIAILVIGSAQLKAKKGLYIALIFTSLWTITHIFVPWLMVLQFTTIIVSGFIGFSITNNKRKS